MKSFTFHFHFMGVLMITLMILTDESDIAEPYEDNEDENDTFMHSYSDAIYE